MAEIWGEMWVDVYIDYGEENTDGGGTEKGRGCKWGRR